MAHQDITIWHNPACSKSRGALAILREADVPHTIVEYLRTPPDRDALGRVLDLLGGPPSDLVRRDARFRELGLDPAAVTTRAQVLDVLTLHPELIERPVVVRGARAVLARPSEKVRTLLEDTP